MIINHTLHLILVWIMAVLIILDSIAHFPDSKVHGANMGPTGPRWAPCWPRELCYLDFYEHGHSIQNIVIIITNIIPCPCTLNEHRAYTPHNITHAYVFLLLSGFNINEILLSTPTDITQTYNRAHIHQNCKLSADNAQEYPV